MADPVSRYGLTPDDLRDTFFFLQIGPGTQAYLQSSIALKKIVDAEDWADGEASDRVGVPLKPIRAPGQLVLDRNNITHRNFPGHFIQAIKFYAAGNLVQDITSETQPASSQQGQWALGWAWYHMAQFKDNPAMRLGRGRQRHHNPHLPPQVAPRELKPETTQGGFGQ
jgi:hypothetical protein